jgi:hypothetical protein
VFSNFPVTQPYITAPALTPDTDVFKYLASSYASTHPTMHQGLPCKPGAAAFQNGTVNGAAWYPLVGKVRLFIFRIISLLFNV